MGIRIRRELYFQPLALFLAWVMVVPPPPAQAALEVPAPEAPAVAAPVPTAVREAETPYTVEQDAAAAQTQAPVAPKVTVPQPRGTLAANCVWNGGNYIIQLICGGNSLTSGAPPNAALISAIQQFESDSIAQWLATYNLPNSSTDVANFYTNMRTSSRTAVRAYMLLRLVDIAVRLQTNGAVSSNEQTVYSWFQGRVQARMVQMDQDAVNNKNNWQNNRCTWKPDPDIAAATGLYYIPCVGTEVFDTAPNADYFTQAAYKQDYITFLSGLTAGAAPILSAAVAPVSRLAQRTSGSSKTTPSGNALLDMQTDSTVQIEGEYGGAGGGVLGLGVTAALVCMLNPALRKKIFPNQRLGDAIEKGRTDKLNKVKTPQDEVQNDANEVDASTNSGDSGAETGASNIVKTVGTQDVEEEIDVMGGDLGGEGGGDLLADVLAGAAGAGIGILIAAAIAIITIIIDEAVAEKSLSSLDSTLSSDQNNAPDIHALMGAALGQVKVQTSWTEITWPDVSSTATLPAPAPTDPVVVSYPGTQSSNTSVNQISVQDWGGASVQLSATGGWLLKNSTFQVPASATQSGNPVTVTGTDMNPTLQFIDWNGNNMWASRVGLGWVIGERFPLSTDVDCPADSSGVTELANLSGCRTYVANSVQLLDANGNPQVVSVATRPVISPQSTTINFNTLAGSGTVNVPVSGFPYPNLFADPSTPLPAGITLTAGNAANPATFNLLGNSVTPGTYNIILHAKNAAQDTQTTFLFTITGPDFAAPPAWINVDPGATRDEAILSNTWTTGLRNLVSINVSSANNIAITTNLMMPSGMAVVAVTNNLVSIGGTAPPGSAGAIPTSDGNPPWILACDQFPAHPCALLGSTAGCTGSYYTRGCAVYASINFNIVAATPAQFTKSTPIVLDFPVNQQASYTLQTAGAITPVSFQYPNPNCSGSFNGLPSWATVTDNGNGSVTIAGQAPDNGGVESVYSLNVGIHTAGVADPPCQTNNLQISQDSYPQLFQTSATVTANGGGYGVFLPSSLGSAGSMSTTSPLPNGMQFYPPFNGNPYSIGGTPQPGSGGQYNIAFQMKALSATSAVTKNFLLEVDEAPSFNLPPMIYMMAGIANQYIVQPGGYPTFRQMQMTMMGSLPSGLSYSGATELNVNTGRIVISGTAAASAATKNFPLTFSANNGIGNPATQSATLHILLPGDVTHDDVVDCNDVALVKAAYGAKAGTPAYNGAADVNNDGVVNVLDLSFVTSHVAPGTVCH